MKHGIDVSGNNGRVGWLRARKDAGFAFIKATEGKTFTDPRLKRNRRWGRRAFGWRVGFYHFARPDNNNARDEARHFVRAVRAAGGNPGRNGVLDYEVPHPGGDDDAWIKAWVDEYHKLTGERPIIYGGSVLRAKTHATFGCPLWLAAYVSSPWGWVPSQWQHGPHQLKIWQYTDKGSCQGISGPVDRNVFFGDRADLKRLLV